MNHLENLGELQHSYYAMRHGRSEANERRIIVSGLVPGILGYGLIGEGRQEVQESIDNAIFEGVIDYAEPTVIFHSVFLRAEQTAKIVKQSLYSSKLIFDTALRERDFGQFEKQSVENYKTVWENDRQSIEQTDHGVESVARVLDRTTRLVNSIEKGHFTELLDGAKEIVLVSHGDPLQILQTAFEGVSPQHHRSLPELKTGEIRKLELKKPRKF